MNALTGTGQLVRLILRLDRVRLPLWVLAVLGIVVASAAAVQGLYDTPQARAGYALTAQSPAAIVLSGPPEALDTVGGITVFEINLTSAVGVALMATFLTVRHTRAEEEAGRTELLGAGVLGRHAPLAASLVVVGATCLLLGLLIGVALVVLGLSTSGSLLFGVGVALLGLFFAAVAAVAAQLSEHARAAPVWRSPCWGWRGRCARSVTCGAAGCPGRRPSGGCRRSGRSVANAGGRCCCRWSAPGCWRCWRWSWSDGVTSAPACCPPGPARPGPPGCCPPSRAWPGGSRV